MSARAAKIYFLKITLSSHTDPIAAPYIGVVRIAPMPAELRSVVGGNKMSHTFSGVLHHLNRKKFPHL
jgi:hypothetical protein